MSSTHQTADTSHSQSSSSEINDAHNLLFKLYTVILNNSLVQIGLRQLTDIAQPIVGKLDDNIITVKSNVSRWITHENVYNHLASQWLARNYPFNGTIVPFEIYVRRLDRQRRDGFENIIKDYYNTASEIWRSINHADSEDIKNAMLAITSKVISKTEGFEDENLSTALYNMLRLLIEKRRELVSAESYFNLVKLALGDDFYLRNQHAMKTACDEYYSFARRFLLVDFPLANSNSILKVIYDFLQDNMYIQGDSALNFVERQIDFLLNLVGEKPQLSKEDQSLVEKTQRIVKKTLVLSFFPLKKAEKSFHYLKDTKAFSTADKYLHITAGVDNTIALVSWGHRTLNDNILGPAFDAIKITKEKTKSRITVVMHGLDPRVVKKNFSKLCNEYKILKKCVVIVAKDTVKMVFDKKTRDELTGDAKKELVRFYQEVKTLERQKISAITMEYYIEILSKAEKTYRRAKKLAKYQQSNAEEVKKVKANLGDDSVDIEASSEDEVKNSQPVEATA